MLTSRQKNFMLAVAIVLIGAVAVYCLYFGLRTQANIRAGNALVSQTKPYSQEGNGGPSILILGDSLAYGVGASSPETSFAGKISQEFEDAQVINKAKVGEDIAGLSESMGALIDKKYDMIFVVIGGNDVSHYSVDIEDSKLKLADIFRKVSEQATHSYIYAPTDFANVSAIPSVFKEFYSNRSLSLAAESSKLASEYANVTSVDTSKVDSKTYSSLESTDGFHLNDAGIEALINRTFSD